MSVSQQRQRTLFVHPALARARDLASGPLRAVVRAVSARPASALAKVTTRSNAPQPGKGSLNAVWGVATFAIVAVLVLAQLPEVRQAFLAASSDADALVAQVVGAFASPGQAYVPGAEQADPSRGADSAAPLVWEAVAAHDAGTDATHAAPVEGSPEPVRDPSSLASTVAAPQLLTADPTAAPPAALATAPFAPTDAVTSTLAPTLLTPVTQAITTVTTPIVAPVSQAVTTVTTTIVAPVVTAVTNTVTSVITGPNAPIPAATSTPAPAPSATAPTATNAPGGGPTTTRRR